jgi:hypothetical protein
MKYQLIFDLATTSKAPIGVLYVSAIFGALALVSGLFMKLRGNPMAFPVKFLAFVAVILLLLSGLMQYERHWILEKSKTELKTIEGIVMAHWRDRVKRAGNGNSYSQWEGFSVGDKQFMYCTDTTQNYFSNSQRLKFHDGMPVKVSYLEVTTETKLRNEITRLEAVVLFP